MNQEQKVVLWGVLGCGCLGALLIAGLVGLLALAILLPPALEKAVQRTGRALENSQSVELSAQFLKRREPLAVTEARDAAEKRALREKTQALLQAENFQGLDELAESLKRSRARFYSGDYQLREFYNSLADADDHKTMENSPYRIKMVKWGRQRPQSLTARVAFADSLVNIAWECRGTRWAREVSEANRDLFRQYMARADKALSESQDLHIDDPHFYVVWMRVTIGLSSFAERHANLLERMQQVDPDYTPGYRIVNNGLLRRWFGTPGDNALFADAMTQRTKSRLGASLYAELARQLVDIEPQDIFTEDGFSWAGVEKGFMDSDRRHPLNRAQMNAFCRLAVLAKDAERTRQLLAIIGDNYEETAWGDRRYFDKVRQWAKDSAS